MSFLSREELLARWKRRETIITLDNGIEIPIREVSVRDRLEAEEAGQADPETGIFARPAWYAATIVQRAVLDQPGGALLFTPEDIPHLAEARGYEWQKNEMEQISLQIRTFSEVDAESFQTDGDSVHQAGDDADDNSDAAPPESESAG